MTVAPQRESSQRQNRHYSRCPKAYLVPVYRIFGLGRRDHGRLTGFRGFLEAGASAILTLICLANANLHTRMVWIQGYG
jgi:hypothetical protein